MKLKEMTLKWLARRLPTCKEVTRMASDRMERKLPLRQWIDFKLHLLICSLCTRYVKQLEMMREISRQHDSQAEMGAAPHAALSGNARERMKQALRT
jgi:hypothetical protein